MNRFFIPVKPIMLAVGLSCVAGVTESVAQSYLEQNGKVVIEAENFASQTQADVRRWVVFSRNKAPSEIGNFADADPSHAETASGGSYIESLPDTRVNHNEPLIRGENFSAQAGAMAILTYPVYFSEAGRYYVWGRAHSTGPEDNGFHFGLNGDWPESSQRLQFCSGKHQWTWSSQQRRKDNHCGTPNTLWVDIPRRGQHTFMLSMREDGAELDKIILTKDKSFVPQGAGPEQTLYVPKPLPQKTAYTSIDNYVYQLHATTTFTHAETFTDNQEYGVLGLDSSQAKFKDKFVSATHKIKTKGGAKTLKASLVTLSDIAGESEYRVKLNGKLLANVKNHPASQDFQEQVLPLGTIKIKKGDKLEVQAKAVSNGKIEGQYSRAMWRGVLLQRTDG
jgi:hypothetical protein